MKYIILMLVLFVLFGCEKKKEDTVTYQEMKTCADACKSLGKGYWRGGHNKDGALWCQCWYW